MLSFFRSLLSPEIILYALVLEARTKCRRMTSGTVRVNLGNRRLDRVGVLDKSNIELLLNNLLQLSGLTDEYRPAVNVQTGIDEGTRERILVDVSIELTPARTNV